MTGWMHRSQDIVVEGIVLLRTVNAGGSELVRAQAGTDAVRLLLRNSVVELRTDEGKVLAGSPVDALGFFTLRVQARAWRDMSGAYITLRSGNREANLLFEVRLNRQERQGLVAVAIDVAPGEGPLPFRALVGSLVDPAGRPVTHRPRGIATDLPTVWAKLVAPDGTDVGTEPWVEVDERGMFLLPLPDDADGVLDEVSVVVATGETIDGEMVLLSTGVTRIVTSNHVTWCRVAVSDALRLDEYGALSAAVGETSGTGGFGLADWWSGFTAEELRAIPWAHLRRRARTAGVPSEMVAAAWQARLVDTVANENGVVFPLAGVDDLAPPFSREEVLYGIFRVRGRSDRHAFRLSKASLTTVLSRAVSDHYVDPRFGDIEDSWRPAALNCLQSLRAFYDLFGPEAQPNFRDLGAALRKSYEGVTGTGLSPAPWRLAVWGVNTWLEQTGEDIRSAWRSGEVPATPNTLWERVRSLMEENATLSAGLTGLLGGAAPFDGTLDQLLDWLVARMRTAAELFAVCRGSQDTWDILWGDPDDATAGPDVGWSWPELRDAFQSIPVDQIPRSDWSDLPVLGTLTEDEVKQRLWASAVMARLELTWPLRVFAARAGETGGETASVVAALDVLSQGIRRLEDLTQEVLDELSVDGSPVPGEDLARLRALRALMPLCPPILRYAVARGIEKAAGFDLDTASWAPASTVASMGRGPFLGTTTTGAIFEIGSEITSERGLNVAALTGAEWQVARHVANWVFERAAAIGASVLVLSQRGADVAGPLSQWTNRLDQSSPLGLGDWCQCEGCGSITGAAAWMFDLLKLVSDRNWLANLTTRDVAAGEELSNERRKDVLRLEVDCENIDVAMPYIDLVNEMLERQILIAAGGDAPPALPTRTEGDPTARRIEPQFLVQRGDVDALLATSVYPLPLPLDLPGRTLQAWLEREGVDRGRMILAWSRWGSSEGADLAEGEVLQAVAAIPAEEVALLAGGSSIPTEDWYGAATLDLSAARRVSWLMRTLSVTEAEVRELVDNVYSNPNLLLGVGLEAVEGDPAPPLTGCNIDELVLSRRARCPVEVVLDSSTTATVRIDVTRTWTDRLVQIPAHDVVLTEDVPGSVWFVVVSNGETAAETAVVATPPAGSVVVCRITFNDPLTAAVLDEDGPTPSWLRFATCLVRVSKRTGLTLTQAARVARALEIDGDANVEAWAELELTRRRYGWSHSQSLLAAFGVDTFGTYSEGVLRESEWELRFRSIKRYSPLDGALILAPDLTHLVDEAGEAKRIEDHLGAVLAGTDLKIREWESLRSFLKDTELEDADAPWMAGDLTVAAVQSLIRLKQTALALKMAPADVVKWRHLVWPTWNATQLWEAALADRWRVVDRSGIWDELVQDLRSTKASPDLLTWLGSGVDAAGTFEPTDDELARLLTAWRDELLAYVAPSMVDVRPLMDAPDPPGAGSTAPPDPRTLPRLAELRALLANEATVDEARLVLRDAFVRPILRTATVENWDALTATAPTNVGALVGALLAAMDVGDRDLVWGTESGSDPRLAWETTFASAEVPARTDMLLDLVVTLWSRIQLDQVEAWVMRASTAPSLVDMITEGLSSLDVADARPHAEAMLRWASCPVLFAAADPNFRWRGSGTEADRKDPSGTIRARLDAAREAMTKLGSAWGNETAPAFVGHDLAPFIGARWPFLTADEATPTLSVWSWTDDAVPPTGMVSLVSVIQNPDETVPRKVDALFSLASRVAILRRLATLIGDWLGVSTNDILALSELIRSRCPAVSEEVEAATGSAAFSLHGLHDLLHDSFLNLTARYADPTAALPTVAFGVGGLPWLKTLLIRFKKAGALLGLVDLETLQWADTFARRTWAPSIVGPLACDSLSAPAADGSGGVDGDTAGDRLVQLVLLPVLEKRILSLGLPGQSPPAVRDLVEAILLAEVDADPVPLSREARTALLCARFGLTDDDAAALFGSEGLDIGTAFAQAPIPHAAYRLLRRIDAIVRETRRLSTTFGVFRNVGRGAVDDDQVGAVRDSLAAAHAGPGWADVATPVEDTLRKLRRDAYVAWLTGPNGDFADGGELADVMLFDPGMNPDVATSRLLFATAAIQRFMQRVQLNLETVDPGWTSDLDETWSWMKQYRVWEAARKVFLYPENWVDPELLTNRTPLFEELSDTLQGDAIGSDEVEAAFFRYLEGLVEVSNLEIVSHLTAEVDGDPCRYVLGRTKTASPTYWIRRRTPTLVWTPWEKVEIEAGNNAATLFSDGRRLMIVWASVEPYVQAGSDSPAGVSLRSFVASLGSTGWMPGQPVGEALVLGQFRTNGLLTDTTCPASLIPIVSGEKYAHGGVEYEGPRVLIFLKNFQLDVDAGCLSAYEVARLCEAAHLVPDCCTGGWTLEAPRTGSNFPAFGSGIADGPELRRFVEPVGTEDMAGSLQIDEARIVSSGSSSRAIYRVVQPGARSSPKGPSGYSLLNSDNFSVSAPGHMNVLSGDGSGKPMNFSATFSAEGRSRTLYYESRPDEAPVDRFGTIMPAFGSLHFFADPTRTYFVETSQEIYVPISDDVPNADQLALGQTPPESSKTATMEIDRGDLKPASSDALTPGIRKVKSIELVDIIMKNMIERRDA